MFRGKKTVANAGKTVYGNRKKKIVTDFFPLSFSFHFQMRILVESE